MWSKPSPVLLIALLTAAMSAFAADTQPGKSAPGSQIAEPQPIAERLDMTMYQRIREEGLQHSHVMEFASALADGIGPRLTGSPNMKKANEWTRDQLTKMGAANAHLEDWGEFGMGWQQLNTWVRMTSPDTAVFIAQATPWSPATKGTISGEVALVNIQDEKDIDQYKGKLAGKIVLFGDMREVPALEKPLFQRYDNKQLDELEQYPISNTAAASDEFETRIRAYVKRTELADKVGKFFVDEKVLAVIRPSRDGKDGGGTGGTIFDDNGAALGRSPYLKEHAVGVPVVVAAVENYGRVFRLVKTHVPVTLEMNVETRFTGDTEHGFDTVAEIPGTDPRLKEEIVMVGGHLDSWIAGTGATDNGAGSVIAMEVIRILKALDVQPRRTIRIALWSGEEQGMFGSRGYVKQHFGSFPTSTEPEQLQLPEFIRRATGPLALKPEQRQISGYFNIDNGTGKVRGVYLQGNTAAAPIFAQWMAPLKDLGVTTLTMRNTGGTDHLSFDAVGIPGFQFIQDEMDYETRTHHSNMDTYERLQPADMKQAATVEAIFVYNAAMRDEMLPRKPLPHPELNHRLTAPLEGVMPGAVETKNDQKK